MSYLINLLLFFVYSKTTTKFFLPLHKLIFFTMNGLIIYYVLV